MLDIIYAPSIRQSILKDTLKDTMNELQSNKAIENAQGETEALKRRKKKLKMKSLGLKVNMPDDNRFLPGAEIINVDEKSGFTVLHTPTPTRMLNNFNRSENTSENGLLNYQLSNKMVQNLNMDSPSMFLHDSIYRNDFPIEGNSRILASPKIYDKDEVQRQQSKSSNYYPGRDDDLAILNLSPYVLGPTSMNNNSPGFIPYFSKKNINDS
jgi:hypothetical protein